MEGFIGEIRMFAGGFAPKNWAFCHGQLIPINRNSALFSIIGTMYGGNGKSTFALPDLRGRAPIGAGQGPGLENIQGGQKGGSENQAITITNMPSHTHLMFASSSNATSSSPLGNVPAISRTQPDQNGIAREVLSYGSTINDSMGPGISSTGGGQPFPIRNPYLGIQFIICVVGVFPSRG